MTDSTDAERRDWLQGYEFALRNLSDEAVQADLARVRAESDTHGSDGQSGQPRAVRESGATTTVAQQECPEGGNHVPMSDDTCGVSCRYCRTPMPEVAGITTEPARSVRRD